MKLNLDYVTDIIGEDYKNWKLGDVVLIEAQTGTGKNFFIENVFIPWFSPNKILFISNRTNLKRQVKQRLLEKHGDKIPETLEELDKIKTIGNVTVASYHALQHSSLNEKYKGKIFDLSRYSAIILDECHFVLSDSGYNNLCRLTFEKLIVKQYPDMLKIFMSATMDEIRKPIIHYFNKMIGSIGQIHTYKTGKDYSNINIKYIDHFNYKDIITNLILNDKSDEKWLIFISDLKAGKQILESIGEDKCSIVKSRTQSEELTSIINNNIFTKKVLIATKALDNGINIKDDLLTNIVVLAWDKVSLLQMLGRKRISINNPQEINLYISTRSKKAFQGLMRKYNRKQADIDLLLKEDDNKNSFNKKYDNKLSKISDDIIYKDVKTNEFMINPIGAIRLKKDKKFAESMINQFEETDKFAYIKKQLEWLGLEYTFDEKNLIKEIILESEIETLEQYLDSIIGQKLFSEDQQIISDLIIKELITINTNTNYKTKKLKPSTLEKILRDQLNLPYAISKSKTESVGEMRGKRYIVITKIIK